MLDNHLRDRLVAGINDDNIKKKLLTEPDLLWTSARDIAISHSSVEKAIKFNTNEVKDGHTVFACSGTRSISQRQQPKINSCKLSESKFNTNMGNCYSCGGQHMRQNCKFRKAICNTCSKIGHISKI